MTTLVIHGAAFTQGRRTAERIAYEQGLSLVTDGDVLSKTAERIGLTQSVLEKSLTGHQGFFSGVSCSREKALAFLTSEVAEQVEKGHCLFFGVTGLLIPAWVTHVPRFFITGEKPFRIIQAVTHHKIGETEAPARIKSMDMTAATWTRGLFKKDPMDKSLYDVVIHADKLGENGAYDLVMRHVGKLKGLTEEFIRKERSDFTLAAAVGRVLFSTRGVNHVWAEQGRVVVNIDKGAFFKNRLRRIITETASSVPGVIQVDVRAGKSALYHRSPIQGKQDKKAPALLVDDEVRYVNTLSERLKIRKMDTRVTHSGEDALTYLDTQTAEVMVLDLKMPGIDGFEVLRRIKATKPQVEVIILTGRGSAIDKKACLELGAFAFLERPVDIDVLAETMRKAHEKIRMRKINEQR